MFRINAILMVLTASLFANIVNAVTNGTSNPQSQAKPDIKVNIQGDTHHYYEGEVRSSGPQTDDDSVMSDWQIQAKAQELIRNKFRGYNINITIYDGTVILKGFVKSDEIRQNIANDVRDIPGVKKVNNLLDVQE